MHTSEPTSVVIASLAAAVVPTAWSIGYQLLGRYPIATDAVGLLGLSVVIYGTAVTFAFASGYLSLFVFRRFALVRWWTAALGGAVWGLLFGLAYGNHPNSTAALVMWVAIGVTCGVVFWAVWRYINKGGKTA